MLTELNNAKMDAIIGHVDILDADLVLHGWALNVEAPTTGCTVTVKAGGRVIATGTANYPRQDLAERGIGTGEHGFAIPLNVSDLESPGTIQVFAGEDLLLLPGSPIRVPQTIKHLPTTVRTQISVREFLESRNVGTRMDIALPEIRRLLNRIENRHGTQLALAMAYVALLKRPIDSHGMETKLRSIELGETTIDRICDELISSHEFAMRSSEDFESPTPSLIAFFENA